MVSDDFTPGRFIFRSDHLGSKDHGSNLITLPPDYVKPLHILDKQWTNEVLELDHEAEDAKIGDNSMGAQVSCQVIRMRVYLQKLRRNRRGRGSSGGLSSPSGGAGLGIRGKSTVTTIKCFSVY